MKTFKLPPVADPSNSENNTVSLKLISHEESELLKYVYISQNYRDTEESDVAPSLVFSHFVDSLTRNLSFAIVLRDQSHLQPESTVYQTMIFCTWCITEDTRSN